MESYALVNAHGLEVRFMPLGGTITSILVPDRTGRFADVVPGFDTPETYVTDPRYLGGIIGRYAGRIANGRFTLDGVEHQLPVNEGANHLHGGRCGFHTQIWRVAPWQREGVSGAVLCRQSLAGEQSYPGTLHTRVAYSLNDDDALTIEYTAVTDEATIVNLTQHTYFNLAGHDAGSILDHELTINASYFTPLDETLIPTGALRGVAGTPFDFTSARRIGYRIAEDDEQLAIGGGYDHNYMIRRHEGDTLVLAARLSDPASGRVVEIHTTEPGLQFYSGNALDRGAPGKGGHAYTRHAAVALETQHFPDSPNHSHFPSTVLRPGEEFTSTTVYRFSTD
jgi:aldose 1-epimerase